MTEDGEREEAVGPAPGAGKMSEEEIDRTLAETFPASDPPPWTLGTDHRDESPPEEELNTEAQRHS
jgi:hypothetical protein